MTSTFKTKGKGNDRRVFPITQLRRSPIRIYKTAKKDDYDRLLAGEETKLLYNSKDKDVSDMVVEQEADPMFLKEARKLKVQEIDISGGREKASDRFFDEHPELTEGFSNGSKEGVLPVRVKGKDKAVKVGKLVSYVAGGAEVVDLKDGTYAVKSQGEWWYDEEGQTILRKLTM